MGIICGLVGFFVGLTTEQSEKQDFKVEEKAPILQIISVLYIINYDYLGIFVGLVGGRTQSIYYYLFSVVYWNQNTY